MRRTQAPHQPENPDRPDDDPRIEQAIRVERLTKHYSGRTVVDGVSFTVPAGSVTGLVGPNGAGKSTIMAMLLGLVRPSKGTGTVLGGPVSAPGRYLHRVGALIETPAFHPGLTGYESLHHLCLLRGGHRHRVGPLLTQVGLSGASGERVCGYSLGMKQRLGIAAALLVDPDLVVLDEPSNGVDPAGMHDLRLLLRGMANDGRTVLLSSHLLGELEQVCDHLVVLDAGGVVHQGPPGSLPRSPAEKLRIRPCLNRDAARLARCLQQAGVPAQPDPDGVAVLRPGDAADQLAATAIAAATDAGIDLAEVRLQHADLESRYLQLTDTTGEHP